MKSDVSHSDYIEKIHSVLRPLIPSDAQVTLFDFPNHPNVGDSSIWLGEEYYLSSRVKARIVAVDDFKLTERAKPVIPEETIILIHGGGNLGDLYPHHQALREHVITQYRHHRVVQLPQSIHFQDVKKEMQCSRIFKGHKDFHLLVRDYSSQKTAEKLHDGPVYLCPDMALCLDTMPRTTKPRHPIQGLLRTDDEKVTADASTTLNPGSIVSADWLEEPNSIARKLTTRIERLQTRFPRRLAMLHGLKRRLYHRLAWERFRRGCDILSSGEVVITDRLHGHIMCTLMNIPHVVLDNSYRKIGNFRDAWGTGEELCLMADDLQDALDKAHLLLNRFH